MARCLISVPKPIIMKKLFHLLLCFVFLSAAVESYGQTLKAVDNTQNAGKVQWVTRQVNTGKVPQGVPVTGEFEVKNISRENLMILDVRSTCYCTTVEWTGEPVKPGTSGVIKVTYDGQREGDFYRIVTVTTNFDPVQSIPLALIGKVDKKQETAATNN